MPRPPRADVAEVIYHVINRANARARIFRQQKDYLAFMEIVQEAKEKFPIDILSMTVMPNHWHFVLKPKQNGGMSNFMAWLTMTHAQRWHAYYRTVGTGHLYQGRYKSFPVQTDEYFLQLVRYVERNPLRAKLVQRAEDWEWGSLWIRENGSTLQKNMLSPWPVSPGKDYLFIVNNFQSAFEEESIRHSIIKSCPLGDAGWAKRVAEEFGIESTLRRVGRPKNGS